MAERTIRTGIGTYQRPDGQWSFGTFGEVVDVHEDDVARFDRLNPAEPEGERSESESESEAETPAESSAPARRASK